MVFELQYYVFILITKVALVYTGTKGNYATVGSAIVAIAIVGRGG